MGKRRASRDGTGLKWVPFKGARRSGGRAVSVLQPEPVPLRLDETGTIRVGDSRVLLELVIHAFQDGATPEAIVERYQTLDLRDVYAVIGYYLGHRSEVESYLRQREEEAAALKRKIEAAQPPRPGFGAELRERFARLRKGERLTRSVHRREEASICGQLGHLPPR